MSPGINSQEEYLATEWKDRLYKSIVVDWIPSKYKLAVTVPRVDKCSQLIESYFVLFCSLFVSLGGIILYQNSGSFIYGIFI